MGKYAAVMDGLKPAPVADQKRQDKIEEAKTELLLDEMTGELRELTAEELAKLYTNLRHEDDEAEALRYARHLKLEALEQLIVKSWDEDQDGWGTYGAGPNTLRLREGYAIDVESLPEGKVVDKEAFRQWCVAPADVCMVCGHGFEDHDIDNTPAHEFKPGGGLERQLQLWPSSMNAIAKERCLAGATPPDGVEVYARNKVKLRKL